MKKILAFSGSNSSASINQRFVHAVAKLIDGVDIIDLRDYDAPIYSQDIEAATGLPENILKLYDLIQGYDSIIISCPEHNGLPTAFLKNTLDWLSRNEGQKFLQDTKVVLLSTSPGGNGGASGLAKLQAVIPYWGATVVGTYSLGSFFDKVDVDNQLNSKEDQDALKAVLEVL